MARFKAEMVLAFLLVVRHRAPRVAIGLALATLAVATMRHDGPAAPSVRLVAALIGAVAAVSASRPLAAAGQVTATRAAAQPVICAVGRFAGLAVVVSGIWLAALPVALVGSTGEEALRIAIGTLLYGWAVAALSFGISPVGGASAGAAVGLSCAVLGVVQPEWLAAVAGPGVAAAAGVVWPLLPFGWRVAEWSGEGGAGHVVVFAAWLAAGIVVAAVATGRNRFGRC